MLWRMRSVLRILEEERADHVFGEALRVLDEVGVDVAARPMRQRLLDAGFPGATRAGGPRFPEDRVRAAPDTDPAIDAEARVIIRAGQTRDDEPPVI
jgi:trimethylamine:corrinoid methyltransferase-like protein